MKARGSRRSPSRSGRAVAKTVTRLLNQRERKAAMWHVLQERKCSQVALPPAETCPNGDINLGLWDPLIQNTAGGSGVDLEGKVIERMVGNYYFRPVLPIGAPLSPAQRLNAYGQMDVLMRVGLMKQRSQVLSATGAENILVWNPLDQEFDTSGALQEGDWVQGRWLRMWEHMWGSEFRIDAQTFPLLCCPTVTGSITGVSPGATTGSIETDCETLCLPEGATYTTQGGAGLGPFIQFGTKVPGWWNLKFDIKRRLRMENTDRLDLWLGWEAVQPVAQAGRSIQPEIHFFGSCKALVGSGA